VMLLALRIRVREPIAGHRWCRIAVATGQRAALAQMQPALHLLLQLHHRPLHPLPARALVCQLLRQQRQPAADAAEQLTCLRLRRVRGRWRTALRSRGRLQWRVRS